MGFVSTLDFVSSSPYRYYCYLSSLLSLLAIPPCCPFSLSLLLTFSPIADPLFLLSSIYCPLFVNDVSLFLPFHYSCRFVILAVLLFLFLIDSKLTKWLTRTFLAFSRASRSQLGAASRWPGWWPWLGPPSAIGG